MYRHDVAKQLVGYTNADWARAAIDCQPTSGFAFSFWIMANALSSKKQSTMAMSSTEAKFRIIKPNPKHFLKSSDQAKP